MSAIEERIANANRRAGRLDALRGDPMQTFQSDYCREAYSHGYRQGQEELSHARVTQVARDASVEDLSHLPTDHPDHPYQNGHIDETCEEQKMDDGVKKFDGGKAPIMQGCVERFPLAIQQLALVSEYGQRKYGTYDGWEKLPDAFNRYNDAGGRHTVLRASEGEYDINDSGLPHLAQRAWNALATLELAIREGIIDMTPGNEIVDGKPILGSNKVDD